MKHEIYTYVCMRTLHDSALDMGRVRWHGAINSSLCLHKHYTNIAIVMIINTMALVHNETIYNDIDTLNRICTNAIGFLQFIISFLKLQYFNSGPNFGSDIAPNVGSL